MIHKGPVGKPFTEKATYFLRINMEKISKKKRKKEREQRNSLSKLQNNIFLK
jgi:hypothetical protein